MILKFNGGDQTQKFTSLYLVEQINFFRQQEGNRAVLSHPNFLKKIEKEFKEEIEEEKIYFRLIIKELETGSTRTKVYELDYEQSLQILMSESKFVRKAVLEVIKQQQAEIESLKQLVPSYQIEDPIERAKMWIAEQEEKKVLENKVQNLSVAFNIESQWLSILKVSIHNRVNEKIFDWRKLKKESERLGFEVKKMPSRRYEYQNVYHKDVFRACYPQFNYNFED